MNNSAIALKRLLGRSCKCECDTYCITLLPRLLHQGEWSLRLKDLIAANNDELISDVWISEENYSAYWTVTPKGWHVIREVNIDL